MKKMSFLPLLALVIAVTASAFTNLKTKTTDEVWYLFTGTSSDIDDPAYYESTDTDVSPGCSKQGDICAVLLPDNGFRPDQNDLEDLLPAIEDAHSQGQTTNDAIEMQE